MRIEEIDKNFKSLNIPSDVVMTYYDVRKDPFKIFGLIYENGAFCRIPEAVAKSVSDGVRTLNTNCAGGRVSFRTNSRYICISAKYNDIGKMAHFTTVGSSGFDMYCDNEYLKSFMPPYNLEDGYTSSVDLLAGRDRNLVINFPTYSCVRELYVGIEEGATLEAYDPYLPIDPIVYYGSSITQGGCVSRPGNTYEAKITRDLGIDHINLGYSGNARGEREMAEYINTLSMSAFVLDYDYNAPTPEHLEATHSKFFRLIRDRHPELPIIICSAPCVPLKEERERFEKRRAIILRTYSDALDRGDKNVYFVDGMSFFKDLDKNMCLVDGCHPNDLGFYCMAVSIEKAIIQAFNNKRIRENEIQ